MLSAMDWLNYHHFMYFWVVATEGSIVRASEKLLLAQPTISGQIHQLEESLGVKLFSKRGRRLQLTEAGRTAYRYAEEIFSLGKEFTETLSGRASGPLLRLAVGAVDSLPPSLVRRFLEPAFDLNHGIQVICRSDSTLDAFIAELGQFRLDVVLADRAVDRGGAARVYCHLLGECGTTFLAVPEIAKKLKRRFPDSLDGATFLLPGKSSALRPALENWFEQTAIQPVTKSECDDSALTKDFGGQGMGVFAAPSVIEAEVKKQYGVTTVGRSKDVRQQFYAISVERKIKHPAVAAISEAAQNIIFAK